MFKHWGVSLFVGTDCQRDSYRITLSAVRQDTVKRNVRIMGRKAISGTAKTASLLIRLTDEERAAIDTAAKGTGQPPSTWARDLLLTAARNVSPSGKRAKRLRG